MSEENYDATQKLSPASTEMQPGQTVFNGRYRLKSELGRGGMGVVWRAEDTVLGRDVALKVLPAAMANDEDALGDLKKEAARSQLLTHSNIVRVHDLILEGAQPAIAMEFIDGPSLAKKKNAQPNRCFSPDELKPWIQQFAEALDYAHNKAKVVHHDLKPGNLMITSAGELKIADFGIARSLGETQARLTGKTGGGIAGTLSYMSPQQLLGDPPSASDDIYSMGATLYELLTSKPPFYSGDVTTQARTVIPPPASARRTELLGAEVEMPPIPPEWDEVLASCLAKEPAQRPASAAEVARLLCAPAATDAVGDMDRTVRIARPAATAQGISAPPSEPSAPETPVDNEASNEGEPPKKSRRFLYLAAAGFFILLIILLLAFWPRGDGKSGKEGPVPVSGAAPLAGSTKQTTSTDAAKTSQRDDKVAAEANRGETPPTTASKETEATPNLDRKKPILELRAKPGTRVTGLDASGKAIPLGLVPASGILRTQSPGRAQPKSLRLEHPDYEPSTVDAGTLTAGQVTPVAAEQKPLPGALNVSSQPTGAEVFIDGAPAGITPLKLDKQNPGREVQIELRLAGHRPASKRVFINAGREASADFGKLEQLAGSVTVRIRPASIATQVSFQIDGKAVQAAGGRLNEVPAGERQLSVLHPDYETVTRGLVLEDKQNVALEVALSPKQATVAVTSVPEGARISFVRTLQRYEGVEGEAGFDPVNSPAEIKLPPGQHQIRVELKGYVTAFKSVSLTPNQRLPLDVRLEKAKVPDPGKTWTIPGMNLVMPWLSPGRFRMGSPETEEGRAAIEGPQTEMSLSKGFWLGAREVNQTEWQALMDNNPSRFKGSRLPVENVTWEDAAEFCRRLTQRETDAGRLPEGYVYALPTEAQWEYACRAGNSGAYGVDLAAGAWYSANSAARTHEVGTRKANSWGFYDMHGNVAEWCADWFAAYSGGADSDRSGPSSGSYRIARGGGFSNNAVWCRTAFRGRNIPSTRVEEIGFRVALVPQR